jgi:hypothetical protein
MAKMTSIVCVAILLLAGSASGVPVDPYAVDGVAAVSINTQNVRFLMTTGDIWTLHMDFNSGAWNCRRSTMVLPVPIETIRDWDIQVVPNLIVTLNGDLWQLGETWEKVASLDCLGPVQNQTETLGGLKSQYR